MLTHSTIRLPLQKLLDLLFPLSCLGCGDEGTWLCAACGSSLPTRLANHCPFCEAKTAHGATCPTCQSRHFLDGAVSCIPYAHPLVQSLIHAWKYLGVRAITQHLARFAAQSIHQASASGRTQTKSMLETGISQRSLKTFAAIPPLLRNEQVLMEPVPLHSKREKERGFNQSLLLAKALATGNPHWTLSQTIARTKKTAAQATLSGTDRHTNIAEAFTLADKGAARGRHIVLVDDVITTGSTVDAIARLLKQAGAESVWALTIAYGHPIH